MPICEDLVLLQCAKYCGPSIVCVDVADTSHQQLHSVPTGDVPQTFWNAAACRNNQGALRSHISVGEEPEEDPSPFQFFDFSGVERIFSLTRSNLTSDPRPMGDAC
jgi:hypothetical protein